MLLLFNHKYTNISPLLLYLSPSPPHIFPCIPYAEFAFIYSVFE